MWLRQNFQGTDGTTISVANSNGGGSDAFDFVSGSGGSVYDDDVAGAIVNGTTSGLWTVTSGNTRYFTWSSAIIGTAWTEVFTRFYIYPTQRPTNTTGLIEFSTSGAATGPDLRITSTGTIQIRDGNKTAIATSSALANTTLHRLECWVLHSTTVGRMMCRIYSGTAAHSSVPSQTIGDATTNRDTAASMAAFRVGCLTNPSTLGLTVQYDALVINNERWIGPAFSAPPVQNNRINLWTPPGLRMR